MKTKCLIIDDEPLAIEVIESYVERIASLEVAGTFRNAIKAFDYLQTGATVDLIFLDIQMPKLTGIEFLKTLKNPPQVIFTTAYREYALEGFELEALDYLLKPISFDRFMKAVSKVTARTPIPLKTSVDVDGDDFIFFKCDKKMIRISLGEVYYIESIKDYVKIKTATKEIVTHQKISVLEKKLPTKYFIRIHRSFIVNIPRIESYSASEVELNYESIPIGRNYKQDVMDTLGKIVL